MIWNIVRLGLELTHKEYELLNILEWLGYIESSTEKL